MQIISSHTLTDEACHILTLDWRPADLKMRKPSYLKTAWYSTIVLKKNSKMRFINLPCKLLVIKSHPSLCCRVVALELDRLPLARAGSVDNGDAS